MFIQEKNEIKRFIMVLTWYCHASKNSKMAAEVFPRMTSFIENSRWRPDLLKAFIVLLQLL